MRTVAYRKGFLTITTQTIRLLSLCFLPLQNTGPIRNSERNTIYPNYHSPKTSILQLQTKLKSQSLFSIKNLNKGILVYMKQKTRENKSDMLTKN